MGFIKNKQCEALKPPLAIHSEICPIFSPPALVGGVRGRVSELAGGVIIRKDKAPPASAKALAPPPKAEGEIIDDGTFYSCFYIFCFFTLCRIS